jgi:hypothetical protein
VGLEGGLTDPVWMARAVIQHGLKSFATQMRLVPENDRPVC